MALTGPYRVPCPVTSNARRTRATREDTVNKVLLHLSDGLRRPVDPATIYYLEAVSGNTRVRRRGARPIEDVRELGEVARAWRALDFVRIHRNHAVNADHILEIRRRRSGDRWEVKLAPPVNKVLPVSRERLARLWAAFDK
jgi:DNA-binding LytR/AlgR family response regulator